ncbi:MAG: SGNH/GDSL hydrolase family protein [Lachnospiraceae bacterium]|nr:SGNH/GDSL hydrolase family protein [Lachnospiraceae bacterium]
MDWSDITMFEQEIKKYSELNKLADQNGIIIMGGTEDKDIPLCELKQAFELDSELYNRSIPNLSINTALEAYDACVAELNPDTILLHIGINDLEFFQSNPSVFDQRYRELIKHIKSLNKKCTIAIISLKNPNEISIISEMNKHLKYIADSEQCQYGDISTRRLWNPKETRDVVSFVYSIGFVHPLTNKRPIYDLIKILFCSTPLCAN